MMNDDKKRILIIKNIILIHDYLINIAEPDKDDFYKSMEDILYFYGFEKDDLQNVIHNRSINNNYPLDRLPELEGVTNAMLFHLKYKMNSVVTSVKEKEM